MGHVFPTTGDSGCVPFISFKQLLADMTHPKCVSVCVGLGGHISFVSRVTMGSKIC